MNESNASSSARLPLLAVLLVALAAGLGLWAGQRWFGAEPLMVTTLYPAPRDLPPFALDGAEGPVDAGVLRGRWTLVFLGFTHCPDICPTTLAQLAAAEKQLADLAPAQRPRILFVSADPERDTPAKTAEYARFFSAEALGATADAARLDPFVRSLHMVYMKSDLGEGDYTIDHSATIAVLDPEVRMVGLIRPPLDPGAIAADLRTLSGG